MIPNLSIETWLSLFVGTGVVSVVLTQHHDRKMAEQTRKVDALTEVVASFMHYQDAMEKLFGLEGFHTNGARNPEAPTAETAMRDAEREFGKAVAKWNVLRGRSNTIALSASSARLGYVEALAAQSTFFRRPSSEVSADLSEGTSGPPFPRKYEHEILDLAYRAARSGRERRAVIFRVHIPDLWRRFRHGRSPMAGFANHDEFTAALFRGEVEPQRRRWWHARS